LRLCPSHCVQEINAVQRQAEEAERLQREAEDAARREKEELERKVFEELPLVPRPFVSATAKATEAEVQLLTVRPTRPPIHLKIMRKRSEFGGRYTFSDKEVDGAGASVPGTAQ
jgi:hypothetical protein